MCQKDVDYILWQKTAARETDGYTKAILVDKANAGNKRRTGGQAAVIPSLASTRAHPGLMQFHRLCEQLGL